MLGEVRMAAQQLVLIGEHAAQMDQPATQERDEQRQRRKHAVVDCEPGGDQHRRGGGGQRMAGIEKEPDPYLAPRQ